MSEENLKVATLEKQILHCLYDNNELLDKEEIDCFISPMAQEFYYDMLTLKNKGNSIIAENILTENNQFLTSDLIIAVQETDYDKNELNTYISKLRAKSIIHDLKSDILSELQENDDDYEKLDSVIERIENAKKKNTERNAATFDTYVILYHSQFDYTFIFTRIAYCIKSVCY